MKSSHRTELRSAATESTGSANDDLQEKGRQQSRKRPRRPTSPPVELARLLYSVVRWKAVRGNPCSRAVSLTVAFLCFPIFLLAGALALEEIVEALGLRRRVPMRPEEWILPIAEGTLWMLLAYLLSRSIYSVLRWHVVWLEGQYCRSCGYDLTGNVSGRCPECGETTEANG